MKSGLALQIQTEGVYKLVLFQGASFGQGLVAHRAGARRQAAQRREGDGKSVPVCSSGLLVY